MSADGAHHARSVSRSMCRAAQGGRVDTCMYFLVNGRLRPAVARLICEKIRYAVDTTQPCSVFSLPFSLFSSEFNYSRRRWLTLWVHLPVSTALTPARLTSRRYTRTCGAHRSTPTPRRVGVSPEPWVLRRQRASKEQVNVRMNKHIHKAIRVEKADMR